MKYIWQHNAWPNLTYDEGAFRIPVERVLSKAGELAGMQLGLSNDEQFTASVNELTDETIHSFAIEGEKLNPKLMRDSLIASLTTRDREQAAGAYSRVADMMIDARNTEQTMTLERLNHWHQQLFQNDRFLNDIGQLRTNKEPMQVVTTKRGEVAEIHYEAPPSSRIPQEMSNLLGWIESTQSAESLQTPVRAALVHLRFETIHPYSDGNGRIGRALSDYIIAQNPILSRAPFSLSKIIQSNKNAYYDALQLAQSNNVITASGEIDVTPFVAWFIETMDQAIDESAHLARHINQRNRFFEHFQGQLNERQLKALQDLFERGPSRLQEGLSSRRYRRSTDASRQTATRDLKNLVEKGALLPATGLGPSTHYLVNLL